MSSTLLSLALFVPFALAQSETAVVTGRLLSMEGKAVPNIRLAAVLIPETDRGESAEVVMAFSETDASGMYRLEKLPPGRYYIRGGLVDFPTYYPGSTTPNGARIVTVARGDQKSGIDFQLLQVAGVKLSGRVVFDPKQKPSSELRRVSLARGAPFVDEVPINDDGTFEFQRVSPGSYSVVIRGAAAVTRIPVDQKDVTGIELKVPLRFEVTARLVVDGNGPWPKRPVGVAFQRADCQASQAQFLSDAPIKLLLLEGSFQSVPNDIPPGYSVTSIRRGELDLLKEPLKIPSNDTSEIVVTVHAEP